METKKQWYTEDNFSKSALTRKFCDMLQNFYLYHILNNENFKMEVEQTNFVTHVIITVQIIILLIS